MSHHRAPTFCLTLSTYGRSTTEQGCMIKHVLKVWGCAGMDTVDQTQSRPMGTRVIKVSTRPWRPSGVAGVRGQCQVWLIVKSYMASHNMVWARGGSHTHNVSQSSPGYGSTSQRNRCQSSNVESNTARQNKDGFFAKLCYEAHWCDLSD